MRKITFFITFISCLVIILYFLLQTKDLNITTFILVRHAEKEISNDKNPPLTTRGNDRARKLADVLNEVSLDAIFSTDYIRTIETVTPISSAKNIEIVKYNPGELDSLIIDILEKYQGGTVLISGHSNTTPRFVNELLGQNTNKDLDDSEYDWIYIVDVISIGNAKVKKIKVSF